MSWLSQMFGFNQGGKPADQANQYLNQIPGVGHGQYDPIVNRGNDAYNATHQKFMDMINDPQGYRNKLMEGYTNSDSYKNQQEDVMKAIRSNSAAGGFAGSDFANKEAAEQTNKLLSADKENYLNSVLGIQGTGLGGETNFSNQGVNARGSLADLLGGALNQQGGMAFQGATNQNTNSSQNLQGIMQLLSKLLSGGAF